MSEEIKLNSSRNLKKYCFPDEWQLVELGEIFSLQQGKALSQKNQTGKFGQPFLRTANILWGHLDLSNVDQMDFTENEMNRFALKPKDLLICEGGEIGRTAIWSGQIEPCFYQNHIHRLRLLRGDVEPEFVMYWMQAAIKLLGLYEGEGNKTTIPNLSKARLSRFLFPLPPIPEQRAIARALRAVQGAREARLREVALEKERKAALMEHLFTKGTRGEATKMTEIGEMPESWEVVKISDISSTLGSGVTPRGGEKSYLSDGIPLIRSQNVLMNKISLDDVAFISLDVHRSMNRSEVKPGDLLLNITGASIGRVAYVPKSIKVANVNQHVCRIRFAESISSGYISYFLSYPKGQSQIMGSQFGTTRQGLNYGNVRAIKLPLPAIFEQNQIAGILQACDSKIAALEREARLLQELFRAMLEELMSGRLPAGALVKDAA